MTDNWSFVLAAYTLAAIVLGAYWRFLARREKELDDASVVREQLHRAQAPSTPAQPRTDASSRSPSP